MARLIKPLTATQVQNAKPKEKMYKLFDGGGLFLQITPSGGKHWKMKYRQANGKEGLLSFGAYPAVSLEQARRKRDEARSQKASGHDPGEVKRQKKAEQQAKSKYSFRSVAEGWRELAATKIRPQTMRVYDGVLRIHLLPELGDIYIKDIRSSHFLEVFRKIEKKEIQSTCNRACNLCSQIMRYAVALELIEINPIPSIQPLLKKHKVTHRAAIIEPLEFGKLLVKIQNYAKLKGYPVVRLALNIMPYIFVRTIELVTAKWDDINFESCEWRYLVTKTNTPHIVPLAPQVVKLFKELHNITGDMEYCFPNIRNNEKHISVVTMVNALRNMEYLSSEMTIHGFRATARTLLDEVLKERYDIIEHQLAHTVRDPNGRAYNRTQHLEERKEMMIRWANYLDSLREKARPEVRDILYTGRYLKKYMSENGLVV